MRPSARTCRSSKVGKQLEYRVAYHEVNEIFIHKRGHGFEFDILIQQVIELFIIRHLAKMNLIYKLGFINLLYFLFN